GYLYWAKRDVQKVADLAALAGAQRLDSDPDNPCVAGHDAAWTNAINDNGFPAPGESGSTLEIQCGDWSPDAPGKITPDSVSPNAIEVMAGRPLIPFFGMAGDLPAVRARAIARNGVPRAAFTVGSSLARIGCNGDTGLLGPM